MSCILHIETSTDVCSVALTQDGATLFRQECREGHRHATLLAPYVDEALSFGESHAIPLDAVAVSEGPGSYTGLRIGLSTAKGVCYARQVPLLTIPTLELLCVPVLRGEEELPEDTLLCPMIDARRMEVYAAIYDRALRSLRPAAADIVTEDSYAEWLEKGPVCFFGNGAAKCREVIRHPNARFLDGIVPLAENMMPLAERKMARRDFADTAYSEPFYLKDFVTTTSRKNILGLPQS